VANAASFVLPISNPANLVLYGGHMPALGAWLGRFALASALSILATYLVLRWAMQSHLVGTCMRPAQRASLSRSGAVTLAALGVTAATLLGVSALDLPLGAPTCILGVLTAVGVLAIRRASPWPVARSVSWSVLPLVAGLFVLVQALDRAGVARQLAQVLNDGVARSQALAALGSGAAVALAGNLTNNLPAGLIATTTLVRAHPPQTVVDAVLIGVDLGPNLSVSGSLATILWLTAIRREGEHVGFWRFLKVGAAVMPPALLLAIGARLLAG
jgi:arsenical pump membrane protein